MAFIPDEAIYAMNTVSGAAFKLYSYLCTGRSRKTGTSYPSQKRIAEDIGCGYTHVSRLKAELVAAGWIEVVKGNEVRPLKGFPKTQDLGLNEVPKSATSDGGPGTSIATSVSSQKRKMEVPKSASSQNGNIPKSAIEVPKSAREVPKSARAYKEEPSYLTSTLEPCTDSDETSSSGTHSKPAKKNPSVEPWYELFQSAFRASSGGAPYKGQTKDFVQLRALLNDPAFAQWLTPAEWQHGIRNYFQSDLGTHTLADFCVRFGDYYKNPLDRYGRPAKAQVLSINAGGTGRLVQ